jgi:hypothetical protein
MGAARIQAAQNHQIAFKEVTDFKSKVDVAFHVYE